MINPKASVFYRVSLLDDRGHSFPSPQKYDFSSEDEVRIIEWFVDSAMDIFIKITGNNLAAAEEEFNGQLSDGFFENEPVLSVTQITEEEYESRKEA